MFDLKPFWENVSGQVIILLAIVALFLIVTGVVTQGFARTICAVLGVFVLIALILMLSDAEKIGNWIKDKVFNPSAGVILPLKGMVNVWSTTIQENLSSLSRFIP
ncbi:hypothetical protein [Enterococcus hirae]|uniref:hypothetical protein n=1 Tax=Enterococcus hirae TaxID=1354 RepID=UPI001376C8A1|nr:hypothetical protein [Enterococcus hirae]EHA3992801.1 hypothetical protein [Enterococcus faecalis]NBA54945.1 hypothetical protein [Enterococcus hirae]